MLPKLKHPILTLSINYNRNKENIPEELIESLPPCSPSLDRAQLPNSGLEEERFESSLYTTSYNIEQQTVKGDLIQKSS